MFFIHDIKEEESTNNNYKLYLDFIYNNYFDEFLAIQKYITIYSFPDAKEILNNFLLNNNCQINKNRDISSDSESNENNYALFEEYIYKFVAIGGHDPTDREIIDNIHELGCFNWY